MTSPSQVTRRRALSLGAGSVGALFAGCSVTDGGSSLTYEPWTPATNTWPLRRADVRNSNANPHATPTTTDPGIRRRISTAVDGIFGVLVTDEYLVAYGNGVQAFGVDSGSSFWSRDGDAFVAAFGPAGDDGRPLYYAKRGTEEDTFVVGGVRFDGTDVERRFSRTIDGRGATVHALHPTADLLFVGVENEIAVLDAADGDRRLTLTGRFAALGDGRVVTTTSTEMRTYEAAAITDGDGSDESATVSRSERCRYRAPAIRGDSALAGGYGSPGRKGYLHGVSLSGGDELWEPTSYGWWTATPAIGDGVTYVTGTGGRVAAIDVEDGSVEWNRTLDFRSGEAFLAGEGTVVVIDSPEDGGRESNGGHVAAFDAATGESLWSFEPDADRQVYSIAAVGDRVYVPAGDRIYVLK